MMSYVGSEPETGNQYVSSLDDKTSHLKASLMQIMEATGSVASKAAEDAQTMEGITLILEGSVEEMKTVTTSSTSMKESSKSTDEVVSNGVEIVGKLNIEMSGVNNKILQTVELMQDLGQESARIITILKTLNTITSKTNLLSLNASIEAARAGVHGRGFAVVASEIRNLAENSKNFTNQINQILGEIIKKISSVTEEVRQQQETVQVCKEYSELVKNLFSNIHENVTTVTEQSEYINEQSTLLCMAFENTLDEFKDISISFVNTASSMENVMSHIKQIDANVDTI